MDEIREDMNHRDLVQFLLARLDEDEQLARAAADTGDAWWVASRHVSQDIDPVYTIKEDHERTALARRFYAAGVLRDVAAKRALIAQDEGDPIYIYRGYAYVGDVLKCLAVSYADHPDYREEWQP